MGNIHSKIIFGDLPTKGGGMVKKRRRVTPRTRRVITSAAESAACNGKENATDESRRFVSVPANSDGCRNDRGKGPSVGASRKPKRLATTVKSKGKHFKKAKVTSADAGKNREVDVIEISDDDMIETPSVNDVDDILDHFDFEDLNLLDYNLITKETWAELYEAARKVDPSLVDLPFEELDDNNASEAIPECRQVEPSLTDELDEILEYLQKEEPWLKTSNGVSQSHPNVNEHIPISFTPSDASSSDKSRCTCACVNCRSTCSYYPKSESISGVVKFGFGV